MKKFAAAALVALPLLAAPAFAADPDPEIAKFREAYTTGTGLAYVVMPDEKGAEQVYRYGDNSREAARRDTRGFMLFTCNSPHVFLAQDAKAKASLLKAKVVKPGEPRFEELDGRYLTNCKNPLVKSALPAAPAKKQ